MAGDLPPPLRWPEPLMHCPQCAVEWRGATEPCFRCGRYGLDGQDRSAPWTCGTLMFGRNFGPGAWMP